MGSAPRRRKGQGGLFIIRRQAWNEVRQAYEEVDFYRATKEIEKIDRQIFRLSCLSIFRQSSELNVGKVGQKPIHSLEIPQFVATP